MLWRGFQKPKRLAVDAETLTEKFGKFSAQPFERGFGTTIGNALRRTLLSSIAGAAVTAATPISFAPSALAAGAPTVFTAVRFPAPVGVSNPIASNFGASNF